MTDTAEYPQKMSGAMVALAAMEYLLAADVVSLNETIQGADDIELGFAVAFLAGNFAAFIAKTSDDPQGWIAQCRRELLDG